MNGNGFKRASKRNTKRSQSVLKVTSTTPTGRAGLDGQKYNPDVLRELPKDVQASYCGE
jgi:hypothetical protein